MRLQTYLMTSLLSIIVVYGCKRKEQQPVQNITDNRQILGCWSMCSYGAGGEFIQMNQCMNVLFRPNGVVMAGPPFEETYQATWTLQKNELHMSYISKHGGYFMDTLYKVRFEPQDKKCNLTLYGQSAEKSIYFLGR